MPMNIFLQERPSIALSLFRIAVALTVGLHVFPSLLCLSDNYYPTALKTFNTSFFPIGVLEMVNNSPVWLINVMVGFFVISCIFFLLGFLTQLSCWLLILSAYYFYALNSFHIGTLSWDILLVTLVLMGVTPYPGDYFSLDALRKRQQESYAQCRPFFIQRLLQVQIAFTFFYTGLNKISPYGNWFKDNPLYYLMNYPPIGVTKNFMLKEWLGQHPEFCYVLGVMIVLVEILMPLLLWVRSSRRIGIMLGCFFHGLLLLTLDVPTIFFFLFPAQLMLFVNPQEVLAWINQQRKFYEQAPRCYILYDGKCGFCRDKIVLLRVMDLFNRLDCVDLHQAPLATLAPHLTLHQALAQIHFIDSNGRVWAGFEAMRRLAWLLPMMYPLIPLFYLPGASLLGNLVYRWVAHNRYLFHL